MTKSPFPIVGSGVFLLSSYSVVHFTYKYMATSTLEGLSSGVTESKESPLTKSELLEHIANAEKKVIEVEMQLKESINDKTLTKEERKYLEKKRASRIQDLHMLRQDMSDELYVEDHIEALKGIPHKILLDGTLEIDESDLNQEQQGRLDRYLGRYVAEQGVVKNGNIANEVIVTDATHSDDAMYSVNQTDTKKRNESDLERFQQIEDANTFEELFVVLDSFKERGVITKTVSGEKEMVTIEDLKMFINILHGVMPQPSEPIIIDDIPNTFGLRNKVLELLKKFGIDKTKEIYTKTEEEVEGDVVDIADSDRLDKKSGWEINGPIDNWGEDEGFLRHPVKNADEEHEGIDENHGKGIFWRLKHLGFKKVTTDLKTKSQALFPRLFSFDNSVTSLETTLPEEYRAKQGDTLSSIIKEQILSVPELKHLTSEEKESVVQNLFTYAKLNPYMSMFDQVNAFSQKKEINPGEIIDLRMLKRLITFPVDLYNNKTIIEYSRSSSQE